MGKPTASADASLIVIRVVRRACLRGMLATLRASRILP
jgi:hypothetical protein